MSAALCPKCNAPIPPKGRFCLECGHDLYQAGVHRPPLRWLKSLVAFAIAVGVLAAILIATRGGGKGTGRELPPEEREVRDLTREALRLAASGSYDELVRRFYQPNAEEFRGVEEALREIVRGRGAPGLSNFRAIALDNLKEASKLVDRYKTQHPDYVVAVLSALTFNNGALRATVAGTPFGPQRAENFCVWHLALAFGAADTKAATITGVRWTEGAGGERLLTVSLGYPEPPERLPGFVDPTALSWRLTEGGSWVLSFGGSLNLDEVLRVLLQVRL